MDLDEVLRAVLDEVAQRLDAERATLFLVDHARGELVTRVAHLPELSEIRLKMGQGIAGWVAQTGEVVRVPDSGADPRFEQRVDLQTGFKTRTLLAVPIRFADGAAESAPAGVLQVLNRRSGAFEREQVEQLEALAAEVASLLAETSLRSQLTPGARSPLDFRFNHIVGDSPVMREVYDRTARAAPAGSSVGASDQDAAMEPLLPRRFLGAQRNDTQRVVHTGGSERSATAWRGRRQTRHAQA